MRTLVRSCVCVCVCVVSPSSQTPRTSGVRGRTSGGHKGGGSHTTFCLFLCSPPLCGACLDFFVARWVRPSLSLVDGSIAIVYSRENRSTPFLVEMYCAERDTLYGVTPPRIEPTTRPPACFRRDQLKTPGRPATLWRVSIGRIRKYVSKRER